MFIMLRDLISMGVVFLRFERGVDNGEYFVFEDVIGCIFFIYFKIIILWEVFEFILNDWFKGRKGECRI